MKKYFIVAILVLILAVNICTPAYATGAYTTAAETRLNIEAGYVCNMFPSAPAEWGKSVATLNYVHNHLSPYVYGYYVGQSITINTVELALQYQAGLCGLQAMTFLELVRDLGVTARTVQCYQISGANGASHVFVETYYGNDWNMFDSTSPAYFSEGNIWNTYSLTEIRQHQDYLNHAQLQETSLVWQSYFQSYGYYLLNYVSSNTTDILYSGTGVIHLTPTAGTYSFANIPNYIGHYLFAWDNCSADLKYHLTNLSGKTQLTFNVSGLGGSNNGNITASDGVNTVSVQANQTGQYQLNISTLNTSGEIEIFVSGYTGYYYPVFSSIMAN
jgi:hypothetical protein